MNNESLYIKRRLEFIAGLIVFLFLLIIIRAVDLQAFKHEEYRKKAERQRTVQYQVIAPRGAILDAAGHTLAESIRVPSIAAIAEDIPPQSIPQIAKILGVSSKSLYKRLAKRKGFVWLDRHVAPEVATQINALNLPGIREESEWQRFYPRGAEVGHLLGFVGIDGNGLEGLERKFNSTLQGQMGIREVRKDAARHLLPGSNWIQSTIAGEDLELTIDSGIQSMAFAALADAVRDNGAKGGSVVVIRPKDSAILAMVSWPAYNPNNFKKFKPDQWRNRAVTDVFEPGSTLKPFTIAAALESKRWKPTSLIDCENGHYRVADYVIHDDHPEGVIDLTRLLVRSSNIGAAKLAKDVGADALYRILDQSGLTMKSPIAFTGESNGISPSPESWGPVETANIAFGQGIAVTTLQLASAFNVFANGGVYIPPHILKNQHNAMQSLRTEVFSSKTASQVLTMLEATTLRDGTGTQAIPMGYRVAGKTGTAQKANRHGGYAKDRYTAVFAGIVPADRPELIIAVVIDEPAKSIYGGSVSAPVFRNIAANALPYLGVSPAQGMMPPPPSIEVKTAPVNTTDNAPTISFLQLSLREARVLAHTQQIKLITHGSGWVAQQKPKKIESLHPGDQVEIWLHE